MFLYVDAHFGLVDAVLKRDMSLVDTIPVFYTEYTLYKFYGVSDEIRCKANHKNDLSI